MTKKLISGMGLALIAMTSIAAAPPQNRITYEAARKTALEECGGKVAVTGLYDEEGVWVYSFEISTRHKKVCMVLIYALTGKVKSKREVVDELPQR